MTSNSPNLEEALHVVPGSSVAGSLKICGGGEILILDDRLFPGPCHLLPQRHLTKRKAFLKANFMPFADPVYHYWQFFADKLPGAGEFVKRLASSGKPVVIWSGRGFTERLQFWWLTHAIQKVRRTSGIWWVVHPRIPRNWKIGPQPPTFGTFAPNELRDTFAHRRRLSRASIAAGAALWAKYVGTSPSAFDRACRKRGVLDPNLKKDTRIFLTFFPQIGREGNRQLKLSEFDQALFDELDTKRWMRPFDLLGKNPNLIDFMSLGDIIMPKRLHDWGVHSPVNPAVLTRKEAKGYDAYGAFSCLLTEHGKRLRDYGLESAIEAPAMELGGCSVYMQSPTWVRLNHGNRSWIDVLR